MDNFIIGSVGIGDPPLLRVIPQKRPVAPVVTYRDCYGYGASLEPGIPGNTLDFPGEVAVETFPFDGPLKMTVTTVGIAGCSPHPFTVPDKVYTIPWSGFTVNPNTGASDDCAATYTDSAGFTIGAGIDGTPGGLLASVGIFDPSGNDLFQGTPAGLGVSMSNVLTEPDGVTHCPGSVTVDIS